MRRVHRAAVAAPKSLLAAGAGSKELTKVRAYRLLPPPPPPPPGGPAAKAKSFTYKAYKGDDVHAALETLFHGKCAYCETLYTASAPVDVEHYRPKGAVAEDEAHGGYWWLAMQWENLLPSCIDCNRKRGQILITPSTSLAVLAATAKPAVSQAGKKDSFPLGAAGLRAVAEATDFSAEHPLLLNPCNEDPAASLAYSFDPGHPAGLMIPAGDLVSQERGAVSIQIYGLNRQKLVEDRTRLLRRLEFLGDQIIELAESVEALTTPEASLALLGTPAAGVASKLQLLLDRTIAEMKSLSAETMPYSSLSAAWLETFKTRIRTTLTNLRPAAL